jgi:hypothetical protein
MQGRAPSRGTAPGGSGGRRLAGPDPGGRPPRGERSATRQVHQMRQYRAAKILLPPQATHPTAAGTEASGFLLKQWSECTGVRYRLSNPIGPFARVAGAGEVVDRPESVTAAA